MHPKGMGWGCNQIKMKGFHKIGNFNKTLEKITKSEADFKIF